ncbi:zinc-binding dehydrogenase [Pseudoduganella sp. SL102]|uniref:zinc-binding dehydrogenase n=1 Tax=Pseudoduganella sp. SL102 TaxID=2995154 RepID=UPI00248B7D92|nr:zinc-binding dehydrogenase [Pseudoduganella sp. SL102]WBS02486.1 zinc-binding dehydrogenase [Pseudoduganella sp. SL102]
MKAAVITSFDHPPRYTEIGEPVPEMPGEMLVEVLAAGLHHITRGRAAGAHYSSTGRPPLVAGVDGVGRGTEGKLRYFVQAPDRMGTMADKTVIALADSIELPGDCDPVTIAAAMNPAMASWLALRCRVPFQAVQSVLILGATGSSGNMAVQVARHLGAEQVIAAGRDEGRLARLRELGATACVTLGDARLGELAAEVDVVLDFVWGEPAVLIMETVLRRRKDRGAPITWLHIGSMAGDIAPLPGALLRGANVEIVGSGHGSVSHRAILSELPALATEIVRGTFRIDARVAPLSGVEQAWCEASHGTRLVFVP